MYFYVQKLINVHSRRQRRRECTSIYVKLFLKNKYWKYVEICKNYSILVLYNMFN